MRLIRSFPDPIPAGRNYVVDDAPRLVNTGYDYRGLVGIGDSVIHLDWDQAISRSDLITFARRARQHPDRVLVGPTHQREAAGRSGAQWNCMSYQDGGQSLRYVARGDATCDLFGFGMVYLPADLLWQFDEDYRAELDAGIIRFNDMSFAGWHHRRIGPAEIEWDINVVHLHYSMREVPL